MEYNDKEQALIDELVEHIKVNGKIDFKARMTLTKKASDVGVNALRLKELEKAAKLKLVDFSKQKDDEALKAQEEAEAKLIAEKEEAMRQEQKRIAEETAKREDAQKRAAAAKAKQAARAQREAEHASQMEKDRVRREKEAEEEAARNAMLKKVALKIFLLVPVMIAAVGALRAYAAGSTVVAGITAFSVIVTAAMLFFKEMNMCLYSVYYIVMVVNVVYSLVPEHEDHSCLVSCLFLGVVVWTLYQEYKDEIE